MADADRFAHRSGLEVAVIGMAGRFPGAGSVAELWQNLRAGVESITFFTDDELAAAGVAAALRRDPRYVPAKGCLEGVELFDADFFGMSAREAEILDPQHRLFLECAWEAIESGGYDLDRYPGWIGVYAGSAMSSYYLVNLRSQPEILEAVGHLQAGLGNDKDFLATRVSYKLNLEGPSLSVQSACSTSLAAVHLACQALLRGECDMALAGGVSIGVPLAAGYLYQEGGILSPDGHCRPFDAAAQGCVGGNGVAVVLLKKLDEALADGDVIHAVVKGSALNNDGALKIGYTAPRVDGQAKVIRAAHILADVPAESVGYIEAHGTATPLGDPVEIAALTQAFSQGTKKKGFCAIGSIKSNLGHLDTAAGATGLIKAALALEHGEIPPSLHFDRPNPQIDFAETPFYVNTGLAPWPAGAGPRRAGVSSFGIGGTNAHAILEETPPRPAPEPSRAWQLLLLSGRSEATRERARSRLAAHLADGVERPLADVAYTLQVGRKAFGHRWMRVCRDSAAAVAGWAPGDPEETGVCDPDAPPRPLVFLLPGQGAQRVGMGADLYRGEPTFRQHLDRAADLLRPHLGLDLRQILYPARGREREAGERLRHTALAQPALFAVEHALAQLWSEWGITPRALLGHSLGELVAACLAGVLRLEDALWATARRGALMASLPAGAMLSVPLPDGEVASRLPEGIDLAAINGPSSSVVAGSVEAIEAFRGALERAGIAARRLDTSHAFHSAAMDGVRERFAAEMARLDLRAPQIPFLSNVTGTWILAEQATDPGYWGEQLRRPVRFGAGLEQALATPERVLLEVGPWGGLAPLARRHPQRTPATPVFASSPAPREEMPGDACLLRTLGQLWLTGAKPDWKAFYRAERRRRVVLPTYPFERRRYWVEAREAGAAIPAPAPEAAVGRREEPADWFYVPGWKRALAHTAQIPGQRGPWLLFLDDLGLGQALAERLMADGASVATVAIGERYARRGSNGWAIDPRRREDYCLLLAELCGSGRAPAQIVHLWAVDGGVARAEPRERELGFTSLLILAQALGEQMASGGIGGIGGLGGNGRGATLLLTVVSDQLHEVTGEERLRPEKATLLGPVRVIPQEYPGVECRNLDIVVPERQSAAWLSLVGRLADDLPHAAPDPIVCYRGTERWLPIFDRLRLSGSATVSGLRPGGCYLITGGLGGIGLTVARGLATAVRANLVLIGRSPLPARTEWERRSAGGDALAVRLRQLLEIEALGAELLVVQADATDADAMSRAIERAVARFGRIHGVFHAAGVPGGTLIERQSRETAAAVLLPKVEGTLLLDSLLDGMDLDFLLLFSSLRAVLGGGGQVDYCAANCFLDSFARARSRRGRQTLAIAWDGWRETGMARDLAVQRGREEEELADGLSNAEGWDALARLLGIRGLPQAVVSTLDFPRRIELFRERQAEAISAVLSGRPRAGVHPRPALAAVFVAPRNPAERRLAEIWSQLLGIAPIGVDDNFFELGGDSVVSLQIVSQANQAGLRLTPRQVFQHQTIAGLAAVAGTGKIGARQDVILGEVPLTPVQRQFFEHSNAARHHYNQTVLLSCGERLDAGRLERAVSRLLTHHDALRLRFALAPAGWRQTSSPPGGPRAFSRIDLAALAPNRLPNAITEVASRLQSSLDLARGPLCRLALLELGEGRPQRLLWTIHHLAVDVTSWRILLEDLEALYAAAPEDPVAAVLPAKTTSYQEWATRLCRYAESDELRREAEHWLGQPWDRARPLAVDHPGGANTWGSIQTETLVLDPPTTRALLHAVPGGSQASVNELLLTAMAQAFRDRQGVPCLLVDVEGLGRAALFDEIDLSRTVGWFTGIHPVLLDLAGATASPGADLRVVQAQLRQVPNQGFGYGVLRSLGEPAVQERLARLPRAELLFLYTGHAGGSSSPSLHTPAAEPLGPNQSPGSLREHPLDVSIGIADERLYVRWTFSRNLWDRATIAGLAASYERALLALVEQGANAAETLMQPADFPLAELSGQELQDLAARLPGIADIYPLTPVQEGLLFHTLYAPGSGVYVTHLHWTLRGDLDPAELRRAWEQVVARHCALRTAFAWERVRRPVQVVLRTVDLDWEEHDWRGLAAQEERFEALLAAERSRGFEVERPPLLRLQLLRLDAGLNRLVWAFHHLILDGWSVNSIFGEVVACYVAARRGVLPSLAAPRPYREYVAWLERQDRARAEAFWRRTLAGFDRPLPLPGGLAREGDEPPPLAATRFRRSLTLSPEAGAALLALGRGQRLTLNSIVQGAWALLLSSHAGGARDVIFGTVTSGRPDALAGVEAMVGLFINTLPVRLRIEPELPLLPWLRQLQEQQAEMREFEFSSLVDVHGWSEVRRGRALFETLLVIENQPAQIDGGEVTGRDLEIEADGGTDQNSYPLTLTVYPRGEIGLEIATARCWFDEETVEERLNELAGLLARMAARPMERLEALLRALATDRRHARARTAERRRAENLVKLKRLKPGGAKVEGVLR